LSTIDEIIMTGGMCAGLPTDGLDFGGDPDDEADPTGCAGGRHNMPPPLQVDL